MISKIISKVKGEDFQLDERISTLSLFNFLATRLFSYLRFILVFKSFSIGFVGKRTKINFRRQIVYGKNLSIDRNCFIDALSYEGIVFGNNVSINKNVDIECSGSLKNIGKGLIIGNNVGLGSHCMLGCAGGIEIGSETIIGNFVSFHSENHNYADLTVPIRLQGVNRQGIKIGSNCWIGAKVTILDGSVVGKGCIIAAGAVLTGKEFPDNSIIGGVPAKVLRPRFN